MNDCSLLDLLQLQHFSVLIFGFILLRIYWYIHKWEVLKSGNIDIQWFLPKTILTFQYVWQITFVFTCFLLTRHYTPKSNFKCSFFLLLNNNIGIDRRREKRLFSIIHGTYAYIYLPLNNKKWVHGFVWSAVRL